MTYKTIVIDYAPKAKKMAAAIEKTANEKAQDGWVQTCRNGRRPCKRME